MIVLRHVPTWQCIEAGNVHQATCILDAYRPALGIAIDILHKSLHKSIVFSALLSDQLRDTPLHTEQHFK